jgi:hypothetical protein
MIRLFRIDQEFGGDLHHEMPEASSFSGISVRWAETVRQKRKPVEVSNLRVAS